MAPTHPAHTFLDSVWVSLVVGQSSMWAEEPGVGGPELSAIQLADPPVFLTSQGGIGVACWNCRTIGEGGKRREGSPAHRPIAAPDICT